VCVAFILGLEMLYLGAAGFPIPHCRVGVYVSEEDR
jgi:hypothetical protein